MGLTLLGDNKARYQGLESFDAPETTDILTVTCRSDEVSSCCPVTGQPDWYTVEIAYVPRKRCVESKSLKLYLQSFHDKGYFCEALAVKIRNDVVDEIDPMEIAVTVTQKSRGGIVITARSE